MMLSRWGSGEASDAEDRSEEGQNNSNAIIDDEVFQSFIDIVGDKADKMLKNNMDLTNKSLKEIKKNIDSDNYDEVSKLAHKLKSSLGQMGAMKLSAIMADIETVSGESDHAKLKEKLLEAKNIFSEVKKFIRNFNKK